MVIQWHAAGMWRLLWPLPARQNRHYLVHSFPENSLHPTLLVQSWRRDNLSLYISLVL